MVEADLEVNVFFFQTGIEVQDAAAECFTEVERKVFRLLCTALYITGIMIDVCSLDSVQQTGPLVAWYDVQLVWAALWGTNCLWPGNTIRQRLSAHGTAPQRRSLP